MMPAISHSPRQRAGYKIVYHLGLEGGGWTRRVELADGSTVVCVLTRGRRVRVAFKPRDFVGFKWYASVMVGGKTLWSDECVKGLGVAGMLEAAGLIDRNRCGRLTYRSEETQIGRYGGSLPARSSYCRNIIPKSWKGQWCEHCTETIAHLEQGFYNERDYHHYEEPLQFGTKHRWVRFYDDALGRWADDGGPP